MEEKAVLDYSFKRILHKIMLILAKKECIPSFLRCKIIKWGGVQIEGRSFFGADISFDTLRPDLISIGRGCVITSGTRILTHFYKPDKHAMYYGKVTIGNGVFIGMNTLIVNAISIGDNAVVGAGSVVTKDIPADEIWAGNPARFIRKRENTEANA